MKVGILGCGYISYYYAMSLLNHTKQVQVVGFCDIDIERSNEMSVLFDTKLYGTLEEMLNDDVDTVINLTTPNEHFKTNMQIIAKGKHVYCEKPLASSVDEALELYHASKEMDVLLSGAPCSHFSESVVKVAELLKQNEIGAVRFVELNMHDFRVDLSRPDLWKNPVGSPWNYENEFEMGCTSEHCSYSLAIATTLFGPVKSVHSSANTVVPKKVITQDEAIDCQTADYTNSTLVFGNGVYATLECGIVTIKPDRSIVIHGDKGAIKIDDCWDFHSPVHVTRLTSEAFGRSSEEYTIQPKSESAFMHNYGLNIDQARGVVHVRNSMLGIENCNNLAEQVVHVTEVTELINNGGESVPVTSFSQPLMSDFIEQAKNTFNTIRVFEWDVCAQNDDSVFSAVCSSPSTVYCQNPGSNLFVVDKTPELITTVQEKVGCGAHVYLPLDAIDIDFHYRFIESNWDLLHLGDGFLYDDSLISEIKEKYPKNKILRISGSLEISKFDWRSILEPEGLLVIQPILLRMMYLREVGSYVSIELSQKNTSEIVLKIEFIDGVFDELIISICSMESMQPKPKLGVELEGLGTVNVGLFSGSPMSLCAIDGISQIIKHINWTSIDSNKVPKRWSFQGLTQLRSLIREIRGVIS